MESLLKLYLVTQDGRVLGVEKTEKLPEAEEEMHLYQEIAPVHPLVVSALDPGAFIDFMVRDKSNPISIPALCFAELQLGELAKNPEGGCSGSSVRSHRALEAVSYRAGEEKVWIENGRQEPIGVFPFQNVKERYFYREFDKNLVLPLA